MLHGGVFRAGGSEVMGWHDLKVRNVTVLAKQLAIDGRQPG